jgi:signal transduction histidine kinase
LLSICRDYTKGRVLDREGNPVKIVLRGKHAFANIDPRLVKSSLANLLTDAINHTPGGTIFVNVEPAGGKAILSVTSKGKSLTRAEISKIGNVRYSRSKNPNRGWGKISVRKNTEAQRGLFTVGNSKIGPKLAMVFPQAKPKKRRVA